MEMTLGEAARMLGGELEGGSPETVVNGVATIDEAGPDQITFLTNMRYAGSLSACRAAAVVVEPDAELHSPVPLLRCENAYLAFSRLIERFAPPIPLPPPGRHPGAIVEDDAVIAGDVGLGPGVYVGHGSRLAAGVRIAAGSYIGDEVVIGENSVIYQNVVIRERCTLGRNVIVYPGAVIGSDGFGYAPDGERWRKIPQIGTVVIEDEVEIGSNSAIDRGALGATRIGRGSKIDNLVQIAHNVVMGENCIMAGQVGISGSTRLGDRVILMGQVGVAGHLSLGDGAIAGAKSGVSKSIPAGEVWLGVPAKPTMQFKRLEAVQRDLPEKLRLVKSLEKRIAELEERLGQLEG